MRYPGAACGPLLPGFRAMPLIQTEPDAASSSQRCFFRVHFSEVVTLSVRYSRGLVRSDSGGQSPALGEWRRLWARHVRPRSHTGIIPRKEASFGRDHVPPAVRIAPCFIRLMPTACIEPIPVRTRKGLPQIVGDELQKRRYFSYCRPPTASPVPRVTIRFLRTPSRGAPRFTLTSSAQGHL